MTDPHRLGLKDDEIAFCRILSTSYHVGDTPSALTVNSKEYRIKEQLAYFPVDMNTGTIVDTVGIVVANDAVLNELYQAQKKAYGEFASEYADRIGVNFSDRKSENGSWKKLCDVNSLSYTDKIVVMNETTYTYAIYALDRNNTIISNKMTKSITVKPAAPTEAPTQAPTEELTEAPAVASTQSFD